MFSYKICFLRVKNLEAIKNLKIYDPDQERSFTKTKFARRPRNEEQRENWETASVAANHFRNYSTVDSAFGDGFTSLPTFVPTDTLEHLKNCRKNTRKSADAIAEFASSKGLRMLSVLFTTSKCVRV